KDVIVVGGANSAGQGALFFSRYAAKVTMLVRAHDLSPMMSHYLVERIRATPNIDVCCGWEVARANGDGSLESVVVKAVDGGAERTIPAVARFIFLGVNDNNVHTHAWHEQSRHG